MVTVGGQIERRRPQRSSKTLAERISQALSRFTPRFMRKGASIAAGECTYAPYGAALGEEAHMKGKEANVVAFKRKILAVYVDDENRNACKCDNNGLITFRYAYNVPNKGYVRMGIVKAMSRPQAYSMIMRLASQYDAQAAITENLREIFR